MAFQAIYQRRRQKIGLTALIDVLFLLLKFFMLTSGFISFHQIVLKTPVKTPEKTEISMPLAKKPVLAYLDVNQHITIAGQLVPVSGLLPETFAGQDWFVEGRPVVLVPRPEVKVQVIVSAFEQLAIAGVHELTLGNAR